MCVSFQRNMNVFGFNKQKNLNIRCADEEAIKWIEKIGIFQHNKFFQIFKRGKEFSGKNLKKKYVIKIEVEGRTKL